MPVTYRELDYVRSVAYMAERKFPEKVRRAYRISYNESSTTML